MSTIYYVKWRTSFPSYGSYDEWDESFGISIHSIRERAESHIKYEEGFCGTDCYEFAMTGPEEVELFEGDEEIFEVLDSQDNENHYRDIETLRAALWQFCNDNNIECDCDKYDND